MLEAIVCVVVCGVAVVGTVMMVVAVAYEELGYERRPQWLEDMYDVLWHN